jgi:hypothetical protein
MTSLLPISPWRSVLFALACVFVSAAETASALTLEIPSRPSDFPLQFIETNGPLHPVAWGANNTKQSEVTLNLTNLVQIASSPSGLHNVALLDDGTVIAWGKTNNNRCNVPHNLGNVVQVAAGGSHSIALQEDGLPVAWGLGSDGQTEVPSDLGPVVQVDAGASHSLALCSDGTVRAWGDNSYGQCDVPVELTNVVQVSSGTYFNLALTANGRVTAWGSFIDSETGLPLPFTNPAGLSNLVQVAAGGFHAVGLKNDSTVVAWGDDSSGQCNVPLGLTNVIQVASGANHSLALMADGSVVTWGENGLRQCDVPLILTNAVQVSGGAQHSIALATRIPQSIAPLDIPSHVNLSNTPSLTFKPPVAVYSSFDARGNRTNATSGLTSSISLLSGPALLTNNTLSFTGVGTIVLSSEQNGNGLYLPASSRTTIVTTLPRTQTISFSGSLTIPFTTTPVTLSGSASSGLPLVYAISDSSVAVTSGGNLTPVGVGTTTIMATQSGTYSNTLTGDVSGYWLPVSSLPQTLVVTRGSQTLDPFLPVGAQPVNTTLNLTNVPRSSSGLPVSFSVKSGPATLSGSLLSLTGGGTVTLAANQAGNANFFPASEVTVSFPVISPRIQNLTFAPLSGIPYRTAPVSMSAASDSGLPVSYSVTDPSVATVFGTNLLLRGVGTTTIVATQPGNVSASLAGDISQYWYPAVPVTNTLIVTKGSQTLTSFPSIPPLAQGSSFRLDSLTNLTASSGLIVSYRIISGNATITEANDLVPGGTGTIVLAAGQSGSFLYDSAPEVTTTVYVRLGQSISSFGTISDQIYKPNLKVSVKVPAASSKLPVTLSVLSGPAILSGSSLAITGGGRVTVAADQPGDSKYVAATRVTTSFMVKPAVQKLGKITLKKTVYGTPPFVIPTPVASSGLPVSMSLSPASLSIASLSSVGTNSSLLTISGAGTVTVMAAQGGSVSYLPVTNSVSFVVAKAPQMITPFAKIADVTWATTKSLTIDSPTSSSGLPVVMAVKSGPARPGPITNGLVTLTNKGKITITADQSGNQNYLPAKQVSVSFTVK